ncbi:MAG: ECF transporter S component [Candidatus Methanomethylicia archaeon]
MNVRLIRGIGVLGSIITLVMCIQIVSNVFISLGLSFPRDVISIPEPYRSMVSLHATLIAFLLAFILASVKLHIWYSSLCVFSSAIISLVAIFSQNIYGLILPSTIVFPLAIGFILSISSSLIMFFRVEKPKKIFSLTPIEISVTAILSALQAFLTASVGAIFPSPTGGYTHIGDTITFIAAFLFGAKISTLTGVIGSLVADFYLAYPRWYVSILAHGAEGLIAGLSYRRSLPIKIILSIIAGFSMAFTYFYVNIFIKGYAPAIISFMRDFFGQALISLILALILYKPLEKALKIGIRG